jgi:mannose-6-phosphate isomerase-like protein (cupin superfamily)
MRAKSVFDRADKRERDMAKAIRRIVTGHDKNGKAIVLYDGPCPGVIQFGAGQASTHVWLTDKTPADIEVADDPTARYKALPPPKAGSAFRIVEFPPRTAEDIARLTRRDVFADENVKPGEHARAHPMMHRTDSIDYVIVMSGEIDMLLDDSEVHMKAGDVMVQQGTNHAWVNRGKEPCIVAFAMIDAKRG